MIAKITRGERVGDIAAYLHGPGKANEHLWRDEQGARHRGGVVIASNIGANGHTEPTRWAKDLRAAQHTRPDITRPIWHASLRAAPGDRRLGDGTWADAAQSFMEDMGLAHHPWVAVRHGEDHIHIVASRISDDGGVWHGRNDRRAAQTACTALERQHGLYEAPRRRQGPKKTPTTQRQEHRDQAAQHAHDREEARRRAALHRAAFPQAPGTGRRPTRSKPATQRPPQRSPRTRPDPDLGR